MLAQEPFSSMVRQEVASMPSPFPGMDPYIEDPEIWSDFHGGVADEMRAELNRVLSPRYVARMTPRVTYEIVEIAERRPERPDVGVWQPQPPSGEVTSSMAGHDAPPGGRSMAHPVVGKTPRITRAAAGA